MNKTIFTSLVLILFLFTSCNGETKKNESTKLPKTEKTDDGLVKIKYNKKINGYNVSVIWKPKQLRLGSIVGPATIEFSNEENEFTITNNYFFLPPDKVDLKFEENNVIEVNSKEININYEEPNLENSNFENINIPFVFIDLDFDGNKELILAKANQGQRFVHAYEAYSFAYGELESDLYQITDKEPFNKIDAFTTLDSKNKELIIYSSGGICFDSTKTYGLKDGVFSLKKIIRMERDDDADKCYKLTYSVTNGNEKLVSREEIDK